MFNPATVYYPMVGELLHSRYQLIQVLSSGAFGQTYLAQDTLDPQRAHCAIKHYLSSPHYPHLIKTSQQLYLTEATQLNRLGIHPQIPRLIDHFEADHGFYLVQEYIDGTTLTQELPLSRYSNPHERTAQAIYLLWDLLHILAFIHEQGVIHCDLKPNNVMRRNQDGKLVIVDFGASQTIRGQRQREHPEISSISQTQRITGYLAAEQLVGQAYPSSDLYAAGILALQLLSGLELHQLDVNAQTGELQAVQWCGLGHPPDYFEEFQGVLMRMVCHDPQNRYASSLDVLEDLAEIRDAVYPTLLTSDSDALPLPLSMPSSENIMSDETVSLVIDAEVSPAIAAEAEPVDDLEILDEAELVGQAALVFPAAAPVVASLPPATVSTSATVPFQWSHPGWSTLAKVGLVVGAVNAFAIAVGAVSLHQQFDRDPGAGMWQDAQEAVEAGNFTKAIALAKAIPTHSAYYDQSQTAIAQWQQTWQAAQAQVKATQQAFEQQQWQMVLQTAAQLPSITHWQDQVKPLVEQATPKAEQQAKQLLAAAFGAAQQRDFTTALSHLYEIAPQTQVGATLAPKLAEYRQKQGVKAAVELQTAYNLAQQHRFNDAIAILKTISPNTPAGAIAQQKRLEYEEKAKLRAYMN